MIKPVIKIKTCFLTEFITENIYLIKIIIHQLKSVNFHNIVKTVLLMKPKNYRTVFYCISKAEFHFIPIFFWLRTFNRFFKNILISNNSVQFFLNMPHLNFQLFFISIVLIVASPILSSFIIINRIFSSCKINYFTMYQLVFMTSFNKNPFNNLILCGIYICIYFILIVETICSAFCIKIFNF